MTTTATSTMVGKLIKIPALDKAGTVREEEPAPMGPPGSVRVLLQEHPSQRPDEWVSFNLAPDDWFQL